MFKVSVCMHCIFSWSLREGMRLTFSLIPSCQSDKMGIRSWYSVTRWLKRKGYKDLCKTTLKVCNFEQFICKFLVQNSERRLFNANGIGNFERNLKKKINIKKEKDGSLESMSFITFILRAIRGLGFCAKWGLMHYLRIDIV